MELLQRRKFCREFLNGYNEKLHPQIISRVFEIGLLTLKKYFNKLLFSKEELDEIIKSLSGNDYVEIVPLPPRKKIEKLQNKNLEEKINMNNNNINTINKEDEEKNKKINIYIDIIYKIQISLLKIMKYILSGGGIIKKKIFSRKKIIIVLIKLMKKIILMITKITKKKSIIMKIIML